MSASQTLQQAGTITHPSCVPVESSVIATNPDFDAFYQLTQATGLIATLQDLTAAEPATLYAPTNEAAAEALRAGNPLRSPICTECSLPGNSWTE